MPTVLQSTATPNNQYLVFDRLARNWIGTWEGDKLKASLLFNYHDGETVRGGLIHPDGTPRRLLVDNLTDDDGTHEGMVFEAEVDVGDQEARNAGVNVEFQHHHGAWATFVEADGVSERLGPLQEAPDAAVCRTFDDPTYDQDNANDDQLKAHREDYALLIDSNGVNMSSTKGWGLYVKQSWVQKLRFRRRARSILVRVETLRGWVGIRKIAQRLKASGFGRGRET